MRDLNLHGTLIALRNCRKDFDIETTYSKTSSPEYHAIICESDISRSLVASLILQDLVIPGIKTIIFPTFLIRLGTRGANSL